MRIKLTVRILFLVSCLSFLSVKSVGQLDFRSFILLSGPNSPGTTLIGSSITINGGTVGAYNLVQTTGNATINANIYSGDKVIITNSNVVNGKIAAGNSSLSTGTVISIGSSTLIGGNIDSRGNIVVGGGTVSGIVTLPAGTPPGTPPPYTYSGPAPGGGVVYGTPSIPILPDMPTPVVFPAAGSTSITGNQGISPGSYGSVTYSGNKTLTLNGPGVYVFDSIKWTGNSNKLILNFQNTTSGNIYIYVHKNADFGKLNASLTNGGDASRILLETHGNGIGTSIPGNSFIIANGSSGGGSKWMGIVYASNGGINIGSGTGSSLLTGRFCSVKQISIQSGVTIDYIPFCTPPPVKVTATRPLNFIGTTTLTDSLNTPGVTRLWQASNGGIITSNPTLQTITVSAAGTYTLKISSSETCFSIATVIVTAAVNNKIGSELLSVYQNYGTTLLAELDSFFIIAGNRIMIDIIVNDGYYNSVLTLLQTPAYGLTPPYGIPNAIVNGQSGFIITGQYPILNLLKLNDPLLQINYARPHYQGNINGGLVTSAGDTAMRSHFVRSGYGIDGSGIKIGVISDSYDTKISATTATPPFQPIKIAPYILSPAPALDTIGTLNPTPQSFKTNTATLDIGNHDLPAVTVLQDFPLPRTDEGRAMLQIIHDVAPGAQLYFRTGLFTAGDFALGIKELRDAGCNIIVDDVTYITESFLKDGKVAKTVDSVVADGVTYISAAGNFANKSYEKNFSGQDITSLGFPSGTKAHNFGSGDLFQHVRLAPGSYTFVFQWVDDIYSTGETGGTDNDMDIFLIRTNSDGTTGTNGTGLIGYNRNNTGGDPIEFIPITINGTDSVDYNIFIVNNTPGIGPSRIKYIAFTGGIRFMQFNNDPEVTTSTLVGQANSAGALAIGAARFNHIPGHPLLPAKLSGITKPQLEGFSSIGGTWVGGSPRQKPDLVGPDGVNTTVKMGQDYPDWALDGYSNFFGTSAAAPHVAAAAALLMEGRKIFIEGHPPTTPPADIKSILQSTAVEMRPTGLVGYDYSSGFGLVNLDAAMRTFAAPTPHQIELVVPEDVIPGEEEFTLVVTGENFSTNSVIYIDGVEIETIYISSTELNAIIEPFEGNPEIKAFTPPMTDFEDGGFSNILFFFDADIEVKAVNIVKQYGQTLPALDTIITVDGVLLQNTGLSLAQIGLSSLTVESEATTSSNVGTYIINVNRDFDETNPVDFEFLKKYNYRFIDGTVTIEQLPLTIAAQNVTITYGEQVPNIQFTYQFDPTGIADPAALLNQIQTAHQSQLANDAFGNNIFGLVNGKAVNILSGKAVNILSGQEAFIANGKAYTILSGDTIPIVNAKGVTILSGVVTNVTEPDLTSSDVSNLSFLATTNTLQNTRSIPNSTGGTTKVVDITQESIYDFNKNAAQTQMLSSVSNTNSKGLIDQDSYLNGKGITILSGKAATILSGKAYTILSGEELTVFNGNDVVIVNGQAVTILSTGETVPVVSSTNRQAVIVDSTEIGGGLHPLKSLNVLSGLDGPDQFILPGALTDGNFNIIGIPGILHINKAPLTVKADDKSRLFGDANPPFTVTYNGFVNGDNLQTSDIKGNPVVTTTATPTSPVSPPTYPITPSLGTLISSNYNFIFSPGALTVLNIQCLLTHSEFKNFGNTSAVPTSLWLNMTTKVSGQLTTAGDYLLFKSGFITFKNISSTPLVISLAVPDGKIVATNDPITTPPITHFDATNNMWVTYVPKNFASTSDIFVTGAIINSSTGFVKIGGNTGSVLKGKFYSNKNFNDQWTYAIAAYQKPPEYTYVTYDDIDGAGQVVSINGDYRAGTPLPIIQYLVQGASGGGGNNYTGSKGAYDNYTACPPESSSALNTQITSSRMAEETNQVLNTGAIQVIPNPASEFITVSFVPKNTGNSKIILSAIDGRKLMEINNGVAEAGKQYWKKINVSNLPNGIYVIRILTGGIIKTEKIIIQH